MVVEINLCQKGVEESSLIIFLRRSHRFNEAFLSMIVYTLEWILCYVMLILGIKHQKYSKAFCYVILIVFGGISVLRGEVGTDTATYEAISAIVRDTGGFPGTEISFIFFLKVVHFFGMDDVSSIRFISLIMVMLLSVFIYRSTKGERFYLLAIFFPVFFNVFSMNTLRIGLASVIFMLALQQIIRQQTLDWFSILAVVLSELVHFSAAFFPVFLLLSCRRWSKDLILQACVLVFLSVALILMVDYLSGIYFLNAGGHVGGKIKLYESGGSPSYYSGLSSLMQISVLVFAMRVSGASVFQKRNLLILSVVLSIAFIFISQFSYAGLRLMFLLVFAASLVLMCVHGAGGEIKVAPVVCAAMILFSFVSILFIARGYLVESNQSMSPFIPYVTVFR